MSDVLISNRIQCGLDCVGHVKVFAIMSPVEYQGQSAGQHFNGAQNKHKSTTILRQNMFSSLFMLIYC